MTTIPLPDLGVLQLRSVTTTISDGMRDHPGLGYWKLGHASDAAIARHAAISALLREGDKEGARSLVYNAPQAHGRKAADRGTRFHAAVEALALGEVPVLDAEIEPYVRHWQRWMERWQPEFVMAEAPVYNPAGGYAGTSDGAMRLTGWPKPLVFDYKTTEHPPTKENRPPHPEAAIQLCAYSRAKAVGVLSEQRYYQGRRYYLYDESQHHEPMPEVDLEVGLAIVVSPYDIRAVPTQIGAHVWEAWLHCQALANFNTVAARDLFRAALEAPEASASPDFNPLD